MAPRLIWSPRSRRNLRDLLARVAEDSPGTAEAVAGRFFARADLLPEHPGQGRRVPEYDGPLEIREVFVHGWRLIYRVADGQVRIVTIVHGARLLRNVAPLS
ncbi:MAG: type II toxin-antitoxin system RelE/ParE family toxin [Amaricoccus sp.]|uniref:type II toxin-antitoxin system RelE/ParE family toxin n=1 Tax=Amaricoccus sp. TaxID=1872485 RepID=UPI003315A195